jgi:antitoxin MazE
MRARLVKIGNSRGIRIPRPLIDEVGLSDEVELEVQDGTILIRSAQPARSGWAAAARALHARDETRVLDGPTPTRFEDADWVW